MFVFVFGLSLKSLLANQCVDSPITMRDSFCDMSEILEVQMLYLISYLSDAGI